ncbi:polysaccharide deacetylase family protein [Streptomyces sp. NPDC004286]|uniref:polysaccharide deacetylase family protein n=1 Tax=Streptomyces sp. NPDC004286 TaxID=3364696 RepID=UPI0036769255
MIALARRITAVCVLGAALAACGTADPAKPVRPAHAEPHNSASASASPSPSGTPTMAAGPGGLTPVFEHGPRDRGKTVALTFDADMTADEGPRAAAGERFDNPGLISALRTLKVPATVFMTGRWAEEYPDQARALGHDAQFEVANHSYSHYAFTGDCYGLPTVAPDGKLTEVQRTYAALRKAGVPNPMPYFRFPGGCYDRDALRAISGAGVTAIQWDVISGDAFATDADAVVRQVLDGVKPGSVVVMHCTRSAAPTTEKVVRSVVPELRKQGYRFVKVSELVRESGTPR